MIAIVIVFLQIIARLLADLVGLIALSFRPRRSLQAENLFHAEHLPHRHHEVQFTTKANAICERVIGTIRRECLDSSIPLSEPHTRSMLKKWVKHYNGARPHMALGPGVPDPRAEVPANEKSRHRLGARTVVWARPVLGGLHHEYSHAPALA